MQVRVGGSMFVLCPWDLWEMCPPDTVRADVSHMLLFVVTLYETDFLERGLNYSPDKRRTTSCCFPKVRLHPQPQHTSESGLLLPRKAGAIRECLVSPRAVCPFPVG